MGIFHGYVSHNQMVNVIKQVDLLDVFGSFWFSNFEPKDWSYPPALTVCRARAVDITSVAWGGAFIPTV